MSFDRPTDHSRSKRRRTDRPCFRPIGTKDEDIQLVFSLSLRHYFDIAKAEEMLLMSSQNVSG